MSEINTRVVQVKTEADKQVAVAMIVDMDVGKGKEVIVRDSKLSLSTVQRNAYWMWVDIVSVTHGESKEEVYLRHKREHLIKIFRRDNPDFEAMFEPLNILYKHDREKALFLRDQIVKLTSISEASVKQMSEFMENVQRTEAEKGCSLPDPDPDRGKVVAKPEPVAEIVVEPVVEQVVATQVHNPEDIVPAINPKHEQNKEYEEWLAKHQAKVESILGPQKGVEWTGPIG